MLLVEANAVRIQVEGLGSNRGTRGQVLRPFRQSDTMLIPVLCVGTDGSR